MSYGLSEQDIGSIVMAAKESPEIEEVILFGSRAKGKFNKASDIDLAVKGAGVTDHTVLKLSARLNEELPLPYFFDIVRYESVGSRDLVEHIDRVGAVIYTKVS
jgi:predicted nucleotidyltransferase